MNKKLKGNTATLPLTNWHSLTILINESGDGLYYQYNTGDSKINEIYEAEIEYIEDTDNVTGYADNEDDLFQPSFKAIDGNVYFISEFLRDNF